MRKCLFRFRAVLLFALLAFQVSVWAQTRVSGSVTDNAKQPLAGVSVLVKGTTTGTSTDGSGNYSLNVPSNSTLVFSFIGYGSKDVIVGNQSKINVSLSESAEALQEVVVTALGIKKETKTLGYATATLSPDQINVNRQPNFMNALQGKMAGVQISSLGTGPAGTSKIRIRGQSSFSGQNSPLIVVNGVPIDNTNFSINSGNNGSDASIGNRSSNNSDGGDGLSSINPDDIEQMTVLKGATAAALYGSRAKDGVIMITTKTKGSNAGLGVAFNSNLTVEQPLDFTDYQYDYGQGENGVRPTTPNPTSGVWSWGERFQPGATQVLFGGVTAPYQPVRNRIRQFYRNGMNWTNTIQLTTSGEKGGMMISASNLDSKGITPNNTFKRQGINFGFNYDVVPKLNVSGTINYAYEDNRNPPQIAQQDFTIPTVLYTMANSMPFDVMEANKYDANGNEFVWSRFRNRTNPYFTLSDKSERIQRDRVFGNVALRYNFTSWLYAQGRIGQDYWARNQNYNFPTGSAAQVPAPAGFVNGLVVQETRRSREVNADFLIGANRAFGKFGVDVVLGGNQLYRFSDNNSTLAQDFVVRGLYTPQNARIKDPTYNLSERKVNSLYAQVGFSYNDYLFLNATARNDWFSTLAPGNRSILYPSITGSFVFSQAFNSSLPKFISFGKLRAAYAEVGSDTDVPPYANNLFYGVNANLFQGQPVGFISGNRVPNANLKPMSVAETELGLEMKFFENRLGFDFTYYNKITSNQIVGQQISNGSGYFDQLINSGQSQSRGIELLLTGSPIRTTNFSWDVSFNAAFNETKLLRLLNDDDGTPERDYDGNGQPAQIVTGGGVFIGELRQVVGQPLGQIYSFPLLRNAQGQLIHTASGLPQRGPQQVSFGSALPRWFGGITNTFNYKGINLSFLIDYRLGNKMISSTNRNAIRHGLHQMTLVGRDSPNYLMAGAGVGPNGEPNIARVNAQQYYETMVANSTGEAVVYNGGFVKLRQVSLGYDFTKFLPKKLFIKGLRLNAVGNNVLLLKKWIDNVDPEQFGFSSDNVVGLEATGVPVTRSIGFNLNAKF
ncbi:MAG: SusC/RagA family TonB-linked outer membrane protein [Cytophagia bacterium]|nr:MAG: SusC/RagA family TonB-linked outer membrane protein [Runella sp.]TAG20333.1 MAG: SusC/RagA family TonB-linked outer membrane protein [Cytophagales bacterium]TAG39489.1 MAG: SusC/RagA family TonB-linked outer membrane protein [Cytophagia bacterium]TAG81106.1 MAG: SusC/RagA family TonB-linked outer membrane protein [Cytophagales bacterium]